jgi:PAS domain S-box-containing protein
MIKNGDRFENSSILRQAAEELWLKRQLKTVATLSEGETLSLVHELEVHKIMLEMMVEELKTRNIEKADRDEELIKVNLEKENQANLLKESEERFRLITRQIPGVVYQYRLRPDGTYCFPYASEMFTKICGVSPKEVLEDGSKAFLNLHPDDYEGIAVSTKESAKNLTPWQHEYRVIFDDGSIHILYSDAIPTREADGSVLWHGFITDITERKKTEEALRQSEERYRILVERSPIANVVHRDGIVIFVNTAAIRMFGLTNADELLGSTIYDWTPPDFHQLVAKRTKEVMQSSGSNRPITIPFVRPDGKAGYAEIQSTSIIFDALPAVHIAMNDISERKETEKKLLDSTLQYQNLVKSASIGIIVAQGEKLKFINPKFAELSGYPEAELLSMPFMDLIHNDHRQSLLSTYLRQLTSEPIGHSFRFRMLKRDLSIRWIELYSIKIDWQGEPATLNFISDIHDRILSEDLVNHLANRFALATRAGEIGIWEFDIVQNLLVWDDKMFELFGIEKGGFRGVFESWLAAVHPEDASEAQNAIQMALTGEKEFDTEFRAIWQDGSIHHIKALGQVQRDESGKAMHMYGTNYDITKQKEIEQTLTLALKSAEAANKTKSEFLANLSHEFRTPLNGIIGFTDLLLDTTLDNTQQQYARNVNTSGRSLLELFNDIIYYIKLENGMAVIEAEQTDIVELTEQKFDRFKQNANQEKLELKLNIQTDIPRYVYIDPEKVRRILAKLLGNALKFTLSGEVELKLTFTKLDDIHGELHFSIRDTGIGINEEQQKQLFKVFSQADNSTTRKSGGIGISLTISNLLARLMGSEIKLSSEPGKGSVFSFTIPANYSFERDKIGNKPASVKRALMIDDNISRRLAVSRLFNEWGIKIVVIHDWLSAISLLEISNPFDVILVERELSDFSGEDAIRMIRKNLSFAIKELPFILLCSPADKLGIRESHHDFELNADLCDRENPKELFQCLKSLNMEPALPVEPEGSPGDENLILSTGPVPVILVAEDVYMNMLLITSILKNRIPGLTILKAVNGREALGSAILNKPDMIFMDIQMPEMSGIEATHEIRNYEKLNGGHIPVIALTAGFEKEKCIDAGMDDFIAKPFNQDKLDDLLSKYLKGYLPSKPQF